MKGISVNIMVVLFSFCMQGCIREDIMPCKDSVLSLRYRYTLNNRYENLFGADVSEIEVYVFDESGRYLGLFSEAGDVLTNDYVMSVAGGKLSDCRLWRRVEYVFGRSRR